MPRARAKRTTSPASEQSRTETHVANRERVGLGTATVERLMKAGTDGVETTPANVQRLVDAPLDRLWKAGAVTRREYEAGDRFRVEVAAAALDPAAPSVDWTQLGGGFGPRTPTMFAAQRIADARLRFRRLQRAIPEHSIVWQILWLALVKERPLDAIGGTLSARRGHEGARAAGQAALRVALAALADAYGAGQG